MGAFKTRQLLLPLHRSDLLKHSYFRSFSGVFKCATTDPRYLPLLALLFHPSESLLPHFQCEGLVEMLANSYPRHLRGGMLVYDEGSTY